jgi:hypothetical protein
MFASDRRPGRLAAAALLLLAGGALGFLLLRPAPRRPDIVLVVWDTCRADRVTARTAPRLGEIAASGVTFRQCFSPSPWTAPAHASLFTGLLPRNHGLREGLGDTVRPGIPLLAETLRDAGYATVCAVANPLVSRATGLAAGFDTAIECLGDATRKGEGGEILRRLRDRPARGGKPLFLFVNLMESHIPYTFDGEAVAALHGKGAVEGARRAAALVTDERATAHSLRIDPLGPEVVRDLGHAYDGSVRLLDRVTGEILDHLRREGVLDDALLVVCGDHGESLGEHGDLGHLMSVRDPVLHVPLVVRWPGRLDGGREVEEQVRLQDLYPTILEAAGVDVPRACGRDASSLLSSPPGPRTLVAEYGPAPELMGVIAKGHPAIPPSSFDRFREALLAVREPPSMAGARKYVSARRDGATVVREEIYDVAADPGEVRNLLPAEREAADRLRAVGEAGR